jgi:hypothetical protein
MSALHVKGQAVNSEHVATNSVHYNINVNSMPLRNQASCFVVGPGLGLYDEG